MEQKIKVHRIGIGTVEVEEVDLEEAKRLVEETYAQGNLVVDQETGNVIDDITADTKEIFLVGVMGGG